MGGYIDPQGFEILNNLRSYYPNVASILMDNKTFDDYNEYAHGISLVKQLDLPYLTKEERELYKRLFNNNECLRLEQERIRFSIGSN
ncbi:Wadjet anti-phage system protein JetD domain-containing protein [Thiospirochaeta perfilievii]|uniref:Wadjet anti-phage system protein JetD domain-containing protein n=1 Tax=Thiospirochaeta perfilievii TaxID=252967 RepID=UPI00165950C7|nr:Wadjet anti-phage system protein JetD domain-containing protein [Thiospirochaeta perfilievii]